eukprot:TRINITY_DN2714_c0_g1_i11.p1 TRINITY_DN2714_c0_g1~~TRINITY_DN2714_c0_g1_i11.p1  ORF type:complete len:208 (-),score=40.99 TRINITY_DN2714_c0_g1_i11:1384-2007(-)
MKLMHTGDGKAVNDERFLEREYVDLKNPEDAQLVIQILRRPGPKRSEKEVLFLCQALTNIKFIQDMRAELNEDIFLDLFRQLRYELLPKGKTLFQHGDLGRNWYLILQGCVFVVVPKKKLRKAITQEIQEEAVQIPRPMTIEEEILRNNPGFFIVNELGYGVTFGEIALRQSIPRTATIVAKEETHLAVLTHEAYNKIIGTILKNLP